MNSTRTVITGLEILERGEVVASIVLQPHTDQGYLNVRHRGLDTLFADTGVVLTCA